MVSWQTHIMSTSSSIPVAVSKNPGEKMLENKQAAVMVSTRESVCERERGRGSEREIYIYIYKEGRWSRVTSTHATQRRGKNFETDVMMLVLASQSTREHRTHTDGLEVLATTGMRKHRLE